MQYLQYVHRAHPTTPTPFFLATHSEMKRMLPLPLFQTVWFIMIRGDPENIRAHSPGRAHHRLPAATLAGCLPQLRCRLSERVLCFPL